MVEIGLVEGIPGRFIQQIPANKYCSCSVKLRYNPSPSPLIIPTRQRSTMTDDARTQSLTIYLARVGAKLADLLKPEYATLKQFKIDINISTQAFLYIETPTSDFPDWSSFFDGYVDQVEFGKNSSTGALLLVEAQSKYFALPFGRGRFMLNDEFVEEKFGLKVTLNCIGEGKVRTIQKRSLDQILRISQEQASRDATTTEFGFDVEQDLLGGVTGTPTDTQTFGPRISGAESLHLAIPVNLNGLPELLGQVADKYLDTSYKKNFPWVDHIAEVTNTAKQDALDKTLVEEINAGQTGGVWMAVPDIVEWVRISRFRFVSPGQVWEDADIHLKRFLELLGKTKVTVDLLKNKRVVAVDEQGDKLKMWSVYKCLCAELDYNKESFLLSGGKWYAVDKTFVERITKDYNDIDDYDRKFPEYQHANEGEYLNAVWQSDQATYALMDQKFLKYPSKMEFCDLYTANKDICHIKRYGQAGALSHLFAQGLISGELFKIDQRFRKEVNEKLPNPYKLADHTAKLAEGEYRIVFGIISDTPGALRIPFFSRLNFKNAVRRLEAYGYRVAKAKITVEAVFSKTRKEMKKKKKIK